MLLPARSRGLLLLAEDLNPRPLPPCQLPEVAKDDIVLLLLPVVVAKVGIMAAAAVGASCTVVERALASANTPLAASLSTRRRSRPSMAFAPAAGKHIFSRGLACCTAGWVPNHAVPPPRRGPAVEVQGVQKSKLKINPRHPPRFSRVNVVMFASLVCRTLSLFVLATSSSHGLRPRSFPPLTASPATPTQAMSETAGKPIK